MPILLAFGIVAYALSASGSAQLAILAALVMIFDILLIPLHELGHALMGLALRMRLFGICIGTCGRIAWAPRIFGHDIVFRTIPAGGNTLVVARTKRLVRLRFFLVVLAGPAVHLLLISLVLTSLDWQKFGPLAGVAVLAFFISNAWAMLISLWPHNFWDGNRRSPNDGMLLWQILAWTRPEIEAWHVQYFYLEGMESRERYQTDAARRWFENGIVSYPNVPFNWAGAGSVLLDEGRAEEARELFLRLLPDSEEESEWYAYLCSSVGRASALTGRPDLRTEADEFSARAYAMTPWIPQIVGERGRTVVDLGRYEEGIKFLKDALENEESTANCADNACYLAIGLGHLGERDEGQKYLALARKLDKTRASIAVAENSLRILETAAE